MQLHDRDFLRTVFLLAALVGLGGLGVLDITRGEWRTGFASVLLAFANYALLTA
jgi:hypothetical protein